jgi:hypothetical protein
MKEIEELFYKGQYRVDPVPKHHVMNMNGRHESMIMWSLDFTCMCRQKLCIPAAVTQGSIGSLALISATEKDRNSFYW